MIKSRGFGTKAALGVLLLAGAIAAPAAAADYGPRGHGSHSSHGSCDWRGHSYAGSIVINGCRTTIRADRDVRYQIVRAFRSAGFNAYTRNGQVIVDYGYCRPTVRWYGEGYRANLRWQRGCMSINIYTNSCRSCSSHAGGHGNSHGRRGRTYDRWTRTNRDYRRPWNRNRCD